MRTEALLHRSLAVSVLLLSVAACGSAEGRKASYIAHGEKYLAEHNYEKARVEFRNAIQIDPKDAKPHYLAGEASEKLGDPRDAFGQYQGAVDLDPKQSNARAALARLYVLANLPQKAIELVAPGLVLDPGSAPLLMARGAARAELGDAKNALDDAETAVRLAPDNDYAVSLLAGLYGAQGQNDKAIEVVSAALQRLPDNVDLRVELADLYLQGQHPELAEPELKKAIELEPKTLPRRYNLERFYEQTGNADAAEKTLREVIALAPDEVATKMMLLKLIAERRGPEQAEAQMQKFIAAEPGNDQLKLALADYQQHRNKTDLAEATYRAVIAHAGTGPAGLTARNRLAEMLLGANQPEAAQALIRDVLKENPRDGDALMIRANLALSNGDVDAAITDLRTVLRDQPNSAPIQRTLAQAHLRNNEPALAEEALRAAVQANPSDIDARFELALVLQKTGKASQSRALLEQLVAESPDNARLVEELFKVQMNLNDVAAARGTADKFQGRHPDQALGFYLAGLADENDHKPDAAVADYEKALAAQPEFGEPLAALVRLEVGRKQPARALQRLDARIAKYPDDLFARNLKGETLLSQGQYEAAAQVYNDAIARQPAAWSLYRGLAKARLAARQNDAAAQALALGIEKNPDASSLSTDLAELYLRLGRNDDAVATYERALKLHPQSPLFANNLAMLLVSVRQDSSSLARARQLADQLAGSSQASLIDTRGWVQYKSGSYKSAVPLLQQATEKSPKDPVLRYHLGMAQFRSGDAGQAQANLNAAVKSGIAFNGLAEAQTTLDQLKRPIRQ